LDKTDKWRLESRYFPSKVGGKPAWLDLKNLPTTDKLACKCCKKPLMFLAQIYAPDDDDENGARILKVLNILCITRKFNCFQNV